MSGCPVCGTQANRRQGNGDYSEVDCRRCGTFTVTGTMLTVLERRPLETPQRFYASCWMREHPQLRLSVEHDETLRTITPPPVAEQADRLLRLLAARHPLPGTRFDVPFNDPAIMATVWASDQLHLIFLIWDYLIKGMNFLIADSHVAHNNAYRVRIAPLGWAHLDALGRTTEDSAIGFVAMWYHPSTDRLRDEGLKPAVRRAGYEPVVMSERKHGNRIDAEIVNTIRQSRILVADLRGSRGGVYYEAGLAQGQGIHVFWTCHQSVLDRRRLHFDIRQYLFTPWSGSDWPEFVDRLSSLIEAVAGRGPLPRK